MTIPLHASALSWMSPERVRWIVVHTAESRGRNVDAETIHRWHRQRGWIGIGYHYVVINDRHDRLADGAVQPGRPTNRQGAHVRGINGRSVGVCLVGDGDREPPTRGQWRALEALVPDLLERFGLDVNAVIGHQEVNELVAAGEVPPRYRTTKSCPGRLVRIEEIRRRAAGARSLAIPRPEPVIVYDHLPPRLRNAVVRAATLPS